MQHARAPDKYEVFEAWLRDNGAKFEMLELREYDCCEVSGDKPGGPTAADCSDEEKKEPVGSTLDMSSSPLSSSKHSKRADDDDANKEDDSEMRGVHAVHHIPPGTTCMSIPRRCLITVEMGQATPIGQAILLSDLDLDAPKHIFLMIYILWDRKVNNRNSFFAPYYDILPKTLSNMPIFWSSDELQELRGSYLLQQIADRNDAIAEDYDAICAVAPALQQICTLQEFKWARMAVCSRNFGLQMDGHRTSALVPHADMLNHFRPRETKWTFDEEQQAFTITSLQHIAAGSQVYDSYGQKCNHRFLLNYGFAVEDNREVDGFCPNEVPIELAVDPSDPAHDAKLEFWTRGEQQQQQQQQSHRHHNQNPSNTGFDQQMRLSYRQHQQQQAAFAGFPGLSPPAAAAAVASFHNSNYATHPYQQQVSSGHSSYLQSVYTGHLQQQQGHWQQQQQQRAVGTNVSPASPSRVGTKQQRPTPTLSPPQQREPAALKRIRVCVSNNENTRILFSLLRALACNAEELHSIASPVQTPAGTAAGKSSGSNANDMARALFSIPDLHGAYPRQAGSSAIASFLGSPGPIGASYHRSCRDIRHPVSLRNERVACQLLLTVCQRQLQRYPTTLEQDLADLNNLQQYPEFSNKRHAKIQVRGEKQVLHHFSQWAITALDVLRVIEEELQHEQARSMGGSVEVQLTPAGQCVVHHSTSNANTAAAVRHSQEHGRGEHGPVSAGGNGTAAPSFEYIIRQMEENCTDSPTLAIHPLLDQALTSLTASGIASGIHHTIVRYCADVLGSLRREEFKRFRRNRTAALFGRANSTDNNSSVNRNSSHS